MNRQYKYLIKNMGILTLSSFSSRILVFLIIPLYTAVLTTEEYGFYDLMISTAQFLSPVLTLNIADAVMRFSMDREISQADVVSIGLRYVIRSFFGVLLFLIICRRVGIPRLLTGFEGLLWLYFVSSVSGQFLIQCAKGMERVKDMGIAGICGTVVMVSGNLVFLLVCHWGLRGFFLANILAQAVPAGYLAVRLRVWRYIRRIQNAPLRGEMLRYSVPLIVTVIGWQVNGAADKYVVSFLCGISANGLLSVSYKIPAVMNTLQNIFTQAWQISAVKEYDSQDAGAFYGRMFQFTTAWLSLSCAGIILLCRPLARLLFAGEFYDAWRYVPFLVISSVINAASGFLGPILSAAKNSAVMAKSALYGSLANIVMNLALVYGYGVQGAAVATAISSFIIYWVRIRAVRERIQGVDYRAVYLSWLLLCVQAGVEIVTEIYGMEVMIIALLGFVNREVLTGIVRKGIGIDFKNSTIV